VTVDVTREQALIRLERLADRLRVVGPRLGARESESARAALGELRSGLQCLADLGAVAAGEPIRPVPELAAHALGDQLLVLGHDLLACDLPAEGRAAARRVFEDVDRLI
jgi:hypothetical protein